MSAQVRWQTDQNHVDSLDVNADALWSYFSKQNCVKNVFAKFMKLISILISLAKSAENFWAISNLKAIQNHSKMLKIHQGF